MSTCRSRLLQNFTLGPPYLGFYVSLGSLSSSGETPFKDKEISIGSSAEHVLVVKRGHQMCDGARVVVMHVQ